MTELEQFEQFMSAYQDMVFATAVRILGGESEAQDISQEVFLRAHARFGELRAGPGAGGWLKVVTRNLCLNHLSRYRSRWRFFSELSTPGETEDQPFDAPAEETHHRQAALADQRQMLEEALRGLPDSQRVPLVLHHFEEMSYEEIAARLRVSLSKVKSDIFRGRDQLRKRLQLDPDGELAGRVGLEAARLAAAALQRI